jgi:thiol-disulfide isomerase/thioredoxin
MISFYNAVNYMLEKDQSTETAFRISTAGVERSVEDIIKPKSPKPVYYTDDEWLELNKSWAAYNFVGHSKVLKKMNKPGEALTHSQKAVDLSNGEDSEINEYNIALLLELNKYDDVIARSEEFIKSGSATEKIKENFKEAYLASKGSEEEFNAYLNSLESDAISLLLKELKDLMIEEPAEDFTLSNLNGENITLADMEGKVVILDFWATWCGPCLNSFPGMKLAVEKFQNDEGVEFLFINTWERVENKIDNAAQFVSDNNYPFHVLMDTENKVVSDYGVSGIPTKFIIDGKGNIRFKSVGFGGNTEHLVDELSVMISLAKEDI